MDCPELPLTAQNCAKLPLTTQECLGQPRIALDCPGPLRDTLDCPEVHRIIKTVRINKLKTWLLALVARIICSWEQDGTLFFSLFKRKILFTAYFQFRVGAFFIDNFKLTFEEVSLGTNKTT